MSSMDTTQPILVDSDAFVGWLYQRDSHHPQADAIFTDIIHQRRPLVTTSYVVTETATVLSHRQGQALARQFLEMAAKFPVIHINETLHQATLNLFSQQEKKGSSVVDCSNVVVMRQFQIPVIFSFDQVYHKTFQLQMATS